MWKKGLFVLPPKKPILASSAVQALQGRGRRSPLYWWMHENFDEIKSTKGEGRTDWKGFSVELARLGLTDINNKPPSPVTARKTWWQVRKDMAARPEPIPQPKLTPTLILSTPTIPKRTVDARPTPQERPESQPTPTGNTALDDLWKIVDSR